MCAVEVLGALQTCGTVICDTIRVDQVAQYLQEILICTLALTEASNLFKFLQFKENIEDHCKHIHQWGTWGSQMELQALSCLVQVKVLYFHQNGKALNTNGGHTGLCSMKLTNISWFKCDKKSNIAKDSLNPSTNIGYTCMSYLFHLLGNFVWL